MRGLEALLCLALGLAPWWKGGPAVGATVVVLLWAAGRLRPWRPPPGTGWLVALFLWRATSALWSDVPAHALSKSFKTAYLLPYVALAGASIPLDRARPVRWLLASTAAVCALGLLDPRRQYEGFFAHHNQMGALALFVGILALDPGGRATAAGRRAALAAAVLGPIGVVLAHSRSALVGLVAAYLAWGPQCGRRGLVAALLLAALAGGAAVSVAGRVEVPFGGSLHIRYLNWTAATAVVRERPVLGVGFSVVRGLLKAGSPAAATALFALLAADVFERNLSVEVIVLPVALALGLVRRPAPSPG